jgi:RNA-splicing ligase RtcB
VISEEELDRLELEDQVSEVGKLTPREYGRLRKIQPQLVYYHIRTGHVELETCVCGRKVIDVSLADKFFEEAKAEKKGLSKSE